METDPRWSITTTVAVNLLNSKALNNKEATWVKYRDVVRLIYDLEKAGIMQKVDGHV